MTPVPVGLTAKVTHALDEGSFDSITLSTGGAMGLSCTEYCAKDKYNHASCSQITVSVKPPNIAEVRDAFLLSGYTGARVLVGKESGAGTITISNPCASRTYQLTIE